MASPKTKVKLTLLITLLALGCFGLFIFLLLQKAHTATVNTQVASQIVTQVFERNLLGSDYANTGTERAKTQWLTKQTRIKELVASTQDSFTTSLEQEEINNINENLNKSSAVFEQLITAHEDDRNVINTSFTDEKLANLSVQLRVYAQQTVTAANNLQHINQQVSTSTETQIITLFSVAGSLLLLVVLGAFVTVWRVADQLSKKEAESLAILEGIGDGVFVINNHRQIILFNQAAADIAGIDPATAIGKLYSDVLEFTYEKDQKPNTEFIETALKGKATSMANHTQLRRSNGSWVPVADSAAPFLGSNGEDVAGVVVVFRDITKERALERAKDEFVHLASHQLRTPATAVKQYLGLVLEDIAKDPAEERQFITRANDSNEEQLAIIEDILSTAKIDAGKVELHLEDADIVAVVANCVDQQQSTAKSKMQTLTLNKPDDPIIVHMDSLKVAMIVGNLISNAIKYTHAKGTITVDVKESGGKVEISVVDTGDGIAPDDLKKLFTKFGRVQNKASEGVQGTGLGLYLAKNFTELQGGSLTVSSELHKGTTFVVQLPITRR